MHSDTVHADAHTSRIYLGAHWASDVLGAYLIGGVLLGLAVAGYLPLKERGVLQTPEARARMKRKKPLRSFPTKGWFWKQKFHASPNAFLHAFRVCCVWTGGF